MKLKNAYLSAFTLITLSSNIDAQVGINTNLPQGILHVDTKSSTNTTNPSTGTPNAIQASDDFIISNTGSVGIGTITPDPSAILDVNSTNAVIKKGFLGPKVALSSNTDVTTITNPAVGLLVYNLGTGDLKTEGYLYWNGMEWVKFSTRTSTTPVIDKLECSIAYITPRNYNAGQPYFGTMVIPYYGGNGGSYSQGTPIPSTGVTGLTATLQAGDLEYGTGQLVYTLTGTPNASSPSEATFNINIFGKTCSAIVGKNELQRGESEYYSGGGIRSNLSNILASSNGNTMPEIENTFRFDAFFNTSSDATGGVSVIPRVYNISNQNARFSWMGMTSIEGRGDANVVLKPNAYQNLDNGMYLGIGKNRSTTESRTSLPDFYNYDNNAEGYSFDFIFNDKWYRVEMSFTVDNMNTTNRNDDVRKWYSRITRMF